MKNLKKAFAFTLVLMLLIGINVPAFAADAEGDNQPTDNPINTDMTSITIRKDYKLIGAGSSPAETFTLEQSGDGTAKANAAGGAQLPHSGDELHRDLRLIAERLHRLGHLRVSVFGEKHEPRLAPLDCLS